MQEQPIPLRRLGATGIHIPVLSLGSWNTFGSLVGDAQGVREVVHTAFQRGMRFFDMANNYGNGEAERLMGAALRGLPRDELILSSKVYMRMEADGLERGLSARQIRTAIEGSLRRIGTDYLDIYFCHRHDPATPLLETITAMDALMHAGKIRQWGTSMWPGARLSQACRLARQHGLRPPRVEQPELNLLAQIRYREDTLPAVRREGLGVVSFSPLASGLLTGKYDAGIPPGSRLASIDSLRAGLYREAPLNKVRRFKTLAERVGCSRAQLAIAWAAAQPGVSSVITGARDRDQLLHNLGALAVALDGETLSELERIFAPSLYRVLRWRAARWLRRV